MGRTLGLSAPKAFFQLTVPLALPGLMGGAALAWARALGEFGATLLFAGNLPGTTQTMPLAIIWLWNPMSELHSHCLWCWRGCRYFCPGTVPHASDGKRGDFAVSWVVDVALRLGALNLELAIEGGVKPVAIIGPNGSGKTTLLRAIAGAHPVTREIQIGGLAVLDSDRAVDLPPEERGVGYVPQGYGLFPHLSVLDNVAFGLVTRGAGGASSSREKRKLCSRKWDQATPLRAVRRRCQVREQQRGFGSSIDDRTRPWLLDEPLSALDAAARRSVRTYLASYLREHAKPTVVVTHDVRDVLALDAEVVVLDEGSVVQRGLHADVAKQPATILSLSFLGRFPRDGAEVCRCRAGSWRPTMLGIIGIHGSRRCFCAWYNVRLERRAPCRR